MGVYIYHICDKFHILWQSRLAREIAEQINFGGFPTDYSEDRRWS